MAHPTRGAARRVTVLRNRWPTRGRACSAVAGRREAANSSRRQGVRRRFAPHQLRHAHALEPARERVALKIIQRQLGHPNLATTSIYLQGIDHEEIIATVRTRRAPMMSASARLRFRAPREARVPRRPPAFACRSTTDRKRPKDAPRSSLARACQTPLRTPASVEPGRAAMAGAGLERCGRAGDRRVRCRQPVSAHASSRAIVAPWAMFGEVACAASPIQHDTLTRPGVTFGRARRADRSDGMMRCG